jgi:arylsulfatase A-like enzyme
MALTHDPFVPTPDNEAFKDFDSKSKVNDPKYFGEMVTYMDKLVGRLVDETETLGIRENTLILFIGDNGTDRDVTSTINNRLLKGDKGHTTNAGTHVPFIANWKGVIPKGEVNDNLIDFTDFLPSILQSANIPLENKTDGFSFYPQLVGESYVPRDWVFCDYNPNWGKFEPKTYVQDRIWKLYSNGKFYNLEKDPNETNPLNIDSQSDTIKIKIKMFEDVLNTYSD